VVNEDFFSNWFNDLSLAIFGYTDEPWPAFVMEFLYLGIPVIVPDKGNYRLILNKLSTNPAVVFPSANGLTDLQQENQSVENIATAILCLHQKFDFYASNALNVAEELEDIYTIEETEQNILSFLSKIKKKSRKSNNKT